MWPILRIFNVEETKQQDFCRFLSGAVAWLRQLPDLVDARAFKCHDVPPHFYSWVAWRSLAARERALESTLWPRVMSTMRSTLTTEPAVHILEVILHQPSEPPARGAAALALVRCGPGPPERWREAVIEYAREAAVQIRAAGVVLGQSIDDRATFVGLLDLAGPGDRPAPAPRNAALRSVQWCWLDPVP